MAYDTGRPVGGGVLLGCHIPLALPPQPIIEAPSITQPPRCLVDQPRRLRPRRAQSLVELSRDPWTAFVDPESQIYGPGRAYRISPRRLITAVPMLCCAF